MFVVLSRFTVNEEGAATSAMVKAAFQARPHGVEDAPAFVRLDVLSPLEQPNEIWLLTYWADEAGFQSWYRSHQYQASHTSIPHGLKLQNGLTNLQFFEHVGA